MKNGKDLMIQDLKDRLCKLESENQSLKNRVLSVDKLKKQLEDLTLCKEGLEIKLAENMEIQKQILEERDRIQYCLDETRKSFSYRLGYNLTTIPRKIRTHMRKGE